MAWPTVNIVTTAMDAGTDDPSAARAEIKQMADNVNAIKDSRSAAAGIASLDSSGTVPTAELPVMPATKGGTGQSSYTVGDILYADTTTTLARIAAGTAGYCLTSSGPGTPPSYQQSTGFEPGTRMSFQQPSAPTGWTKDTSASLNDSLMRIVTGTTSSGGSVGWSTATVGATTLTTTQIPAHGHVETSGTAATTGANRWITSSANGTTAVNNNSINTTANAGGGGSHTHGIAGNCKYYDFIIAEKD